MKIEKQIKIYETEKNVFVLTTGNNKSAVVVDTVRNMVYRYTERCLYNKDWILSKNDKRSNVNLSLIISDIGKKWYSVSDSVLNTKIFKYISKDTEEVYFKPASEYKIIFNGKHIASVKNESQARDVVSAIGNRNKDYSAEDILKTFSKNIFVK